MDIVKLFIDLRINGVRVYLTEAGAQLLGQLYQEGAKA